MTTGLPAGYHVQPSCATCRFRFEYADYDVGDELFCTVDGATRPKCGSMALHEDFVAVFEREAWEDWGEAHHVVPSGVCPEYKEAS